MVAYLVIVERENIFTVDASTEVAAFRITDPLLSEWTLGPARLIEDPFADVAASRNLADQSLLVVEPGTRVRLQRHGVGQLRIQLTADAGTTAGRVELADSSRISLGDWALLLVEVAGRPLVFPFRGTLAVGDDVAAGVDSIMLNGTVSVVEEQLLGKTHYVAGGEALDTGDRVQLWNKAPYGSVEPEPAVVSGFVRAEAMEGFSEPVNALTLVAHGQADYVQVERLGSAGYHIHAPHWARFLHDPLLAASTAIIALVALLFEVLSKCGVLIGGNTGKHEKESGAEVEPDDRGRAALRPEARPGEQAALTREEENPK
ncbi:hypothetical protein D6C00_10585 [Thiohalobacter thiocyanaticus]|uniref:Uncharacterized protein n=1 Tax=Thiohalobacter thiocyanaticus TaxID=585455 RepID=A0A426QKS2_9GAMM|nr:hypothetical protein D6C00_10585 [Thiohalobacter thiocyanaticus]